MHRASLHRFRKSSNAHVRALTNRIARMAIANRTRRSATFFSDLKSAFPCFRTRDPWIPRKQTSQASVVAQIWHPTWFSFPSLSPCNTRLWLQTCEYVRAYGCVCVCIYTLTSEHIHMRCRATGTWEHQIWVYTFKNAFMEKRNFLIYDDYRHYTFSYVWAATCFERRLLVNTVNVKVGMGHSL